MPEKKVYYEPTDLGFEKEIKERLKKLKKPGKAAPDI